MLVSSQNLQDLNASAKVTFLLAVAGLFFGMTLTAAGSYLALPAVLKALASPEYVLRYQAARLPYAGVALLPEVVARRAIVKAERPDIHARLDAIPFYAVLGGLAGFFLLPYFVIQVKSFRITRDADAGRLNIIPRR